MKMQIYRPSNWQGEFVSQLKLAITAAGSKSALSREIGVHYTTVTDWLRGSCPSDEKMKRVEVFLQELTTKSKNSDETQTEESMKNDYHS